MGGCSKDLDLQQSCKSQLGVRDLSKGQLGVTEGLYPSGESVENEVEMGSK